MKGVKRVQAFRKKRHSQQDARLGIGEVCMEQLEHDITAGIDYFWARRPHLHTPRTEGCRMDFSQRRTA